MDKGEKKNKEKIKKRITTRYHMILLGEWKSKIGCHEPKKLPSKGKGRHARESLKATHEWQYHNTYYPITLTPSYFILKHKSYPPVTIQIIQTNKLIITSSIFFIEFVCIQCCYILNNLIRRRETYVLN